MALFQFELFRGASKHSYFFKPVNARKAKRGLTAREDLSFSSKQGVLALSWW